MLLSRFTSHARLTTHEMPRVLSFSGTAHWRWRWVCVPPAARRNPSKFLCKKKGGMNELPAASGTQELRTECRSDVAIDPLRLSAQRRRQGGPTWDGHSESMYDPQDQLRHPRLLSWAIWSTLWVRKVGMVAIPPKSRVCVPPNVF